VSIFGIDMYERLPFLAAESMAMDSTLVVAKSLFFAVYNSKFALQSS
jgi:hypothetical protein